MVHRAGHDDRPLRGGVAGDLAGDRTGVCRAGDGEGPAGGSGNLDERAQPHRGHRRLQRFRQHPGVPAHEQPFLVAAGRRCVGAAEPGPPERGASEPDRSAHRAGLADETQARSGEDSPRRHRQEDHYGGLHPRTELIAVMMRSPNAEEAKAIVDCFLNTYVAQFGNAEDSQGNQNLTLLSDKLKELQKVIQNRRKEISDLAEPYGTTSLTPVEEMKLNVQGRLMGELINLESQKIAAEANVDLLKKTEKVELSPEQKVSLRREYVNSDPMVSELSKSIVSMERDLITQQALVKEHPRLSQELAALESLKAKLADKRKELEQEYDSGLEAREKEAARQRLTVAEMELEQINARYAALSDRVSQQDTQTQQVGRTNMSIQDRQFQLQVEQDQYDTLYRRIKSLEMERRPAAGRIETPFAADVIETNDRRIQLATAAVIGALACGFGLAFLRDRMDKRLQTPEDVTRQLDLPVLGTTTSSHALKPALFAEQIAGDYQTIRTNLGLMNDGGLPRRLVVSSAGTREGKTTFAVNLATSLAKSGKKVLLIDGDLRKPDVGQMLNVPKDTGYLQDVLLGGDSSGIAYVSPASGLHVLAANPRHMADPYELLTSSMAAEQIERLTREYDHIVIDSPPALAFPDALVWAKLADAVVLVGFAGQTTAPDLKEAKERFTRGRARVLGAVLSNVPVDQGLYRYAYTYRVRSTAEGRKTKKLLLASQKPGDNGRRLPERRSQDCEAVESTVEL